MKVLDQRDLTLMNISLVVEFSGLTLVAQFGYASVLTYILLILSLFIPIELIVSELNARMPGEGGFYFWNCNSFGDTHGFIAAWSYWVSKIKWFNTSKKFALLTGGVAFLITFTACILAILPSGSILNYGLYLAQVLGGAVLLNGIGLIIYFRNRKSKQAN